LGTEIFYFSGTGNSLVVARDLAIHLNAYEIPMAALIGKVLINTDADVIGIVFPVHNVVNGGIPSIVRRFVSALQTKPEAYIFSVCTCGVGSGEALPNLARILKANDRKLSAGFTVKMPCNYPPFNDKAEQIKRFRDWQHTLEEVCATVIAGQESAINDIHPIIKGAVYPVGAFMKRTILKNFRKLAQDSNLGFDEAVRNIDQSYEYDDKCDGCGICEQVCPVKNIALVDDKPVWQHKCESCLACLVWCPKKAISGGILSGQEGSYRHPKVKLAAMLKHRPK
jgi:ferredoxin